MRGLSLMVLAGVLFAAPVLAADGDPAAGKKAFDSRCGTCHSLDISARKMGPYLTGILGRKAGAVEGFRYTEALKNSGLTFDQATLDAFLANPRKTVPGSAMVIGVPDAKTRADIIAYLASAH